MSVCPLDHRYGRDQMKAIFSEEARFQRYLDVESALARAHVKFGSVSAQEAQMITQKATLEFVKVERVKEIEMETNHDIMALVKALAEQCGDAGGKVHLGATSNDIVDTSTGLQVRDALVMIEKGIIELQNALADQAEKHRDTIMLGRTHAQAAVPITFGLKMAVFGQEVHRHLWRLREARRRVCVGKLLGATGTGSALGPNALEIQSAVMEDLGLGYEEAPTQLVGRDRYAEFIFLLANLSGTIERLGTEIRNLQRTEISEVAEAFDAEKQVGSSTMAHKRNPITSENVCGLARIVRGMVTPSLEAMVLWHERDLSNSSTERFTISHSVLILDDILYKMIDVVKNLYVDKERMIKNIEATKGAIMGESVMMVLTEKGVGRQKAHEIVRKASMTMIADGRPLLDLLKEDPDVTGALTDDELQRAMDPAHYTGVSSKIIDNVLKTIRERP